MEQDTKIEKAYGRVSDDQQSIQYNIRLVVQYQAKQWAKHGFDVKLMSGC